MSRNLHFAKACQGRIRSFPARHSRNDIGNRKQTKSGQDLITGTQHTANYWNNLLNQITWRDVPSFAGLSGTAATNATVTVDNRRALRQTNYWWAEGLLTNSAAPAWQSLITVGVISNSTSPDIVTSVTGNVFAAKSPEQFLYDMDGNRTNDGRFSTTWDAENRALSFTRVSGVPAGAKVKLDCAYDSQWRRTQKIVSMWNGSAYAAQSTNKFIYDGWNLVAILDGTNGLDRTFTWGMDMSGQSPLLGGAGGGLQGAGGVGGLISMTIHRGTNAGTYFPVLDGNGNVTAYVNAASGLVAAEFEHGPFGELLRATGPLARECVFLFSTKFYDWETSLYYYGYRYYDPSTGTWLSRDPLEEAGGINLYGFVHNNPINYVDSDGRQILSPYQPPPPPPRPPPGKPNEESFYNVHYSKNSITLNFHGCCNCDGLRDRLYGDLKTFKDWGENSVASINVSGDIASFYPGFGVASGGGLAGNDANWRVRLSNDDSTHCVSARTLDDHPLVGVRKWCASLSKTTCAVTITTEAYERPRNWQNYIGGQWFGRDDQRQIWEDYFGNIAGAYKDDPCFLSSQRGTPVQRDTGSTTNPWVP